MMHKAWSSTEKVPYCFSSSSVKFQGHTGQKIVWLFPDCKSSIGEVPYFFQGHPSNFKVTRDKKSTILTRIERFRTVTLVWIHWWLWNDARSLKQHRRGALLFFKVIRQISRSHGTKNWYIEAGWWKILIWAFCHFPRLTILIWAFCHFPRPTSWKWPRESMYTQIVLLTS